MFKYTEYAKGEKQEKSDLNISELLIALEKLLVDVDHSVNRISVRLGSKVDEQQSIANTRLVPPASISVTEYLCQIKSTVGHINSELVSLNDYVDAVLGDTTLK